MDSAYALRPSAASRWVHCPGSVPLSALYPEAETASAAEGTAAHWVVTELFEGRIMGLGTGATAPNGVAVTDEMLEGAALYVGAVYDRIDPDTLDVEQSMPCTSIHPANGGTPDTWGLGYLQPSTIELFDYKFGHEYVDAFENWQCIDYVSGVLDRLIRERGWSATLDDREVRVNITVVQPRSYHRDGPVRTWSTTLADLRAHFNLLRGSAIEAMGDAPRTVAGDYCDHCPGRHACVTVQRSAYRAAAMSGDAVPFDLDAGQTGNELRWLQTAAKRLDARITGLEEQAEAMLKRGESVPHFALEQSAGKLVWKEGAEPAVIALGKAFRKDLAKPAAALTPTQCKKLIDGSVIESYCHVVRGSIKLVPADTSATRKIFGAKPQ